MIQAFDILWGNILSLTRGDLLLVVGVSLFILGVVALFFKEIQAILYDRDVALAVGLPAKGFYYLIVFILGLSIAVSMRMIGALLVDAFILLPAIAATLDLQKSEAGLPLFIPVWFDFRSPRPLSFVSPGPSHEFHDHPGRFGHHWFLHPY